MGIFLRCAAHSLHYRSAYLRVCLCLSQLPLSQLVLSPSISCRDFTSLFTTYRPSAALPLVICTAFLLDMRASPLSPSDAASFSSVLVWRFFFSPPPPLGGLTSLHDFLNANHSAPIRHDPDSSHLSRPYSHISSHFKWCLSACGMREMCHVASVHSYKNSAASP